MISKLKEKTVQLKYKKLIAEKSIRKQDTNKVISVAILLDNDGLVNVITANLTNKLPFTKKQLTFLTQKEYVKKQEASPTFFTDNDFGYNGSLKSDNLKSFVEKEFDLLINYTKAPNLLINMVTLLSKAKLKAGFAAIDDRLFDIIVCDKNFNEAVLNQELKKYLTILNKI